MKIVFRDDRLALVRTDRAAKTKLPFPVIKSAREKLIILEAAPNEQVLRNWRSLRYEKLKGDRQNQRSIRINNQWRMVFELDDHTEPPTINVLAIEDYH